jgi:hypothetical protein
LLDGMHSKETSIQKRQMIDRVKVGFLTQREVDNSNGKSYFDELTALEEKVSAPKNVLSHFGSCHPLSWLELS